MKTPTILISLVKDTILLYEKVKSHMGWDSKKTLLWFTTENPLLGNVKPADMIVIGRSGKLEKFIDGLIEESTRPVFATADICPHGTSSSLCEWCGAKATAEIQAEIIDRLRNALGDFVLGHEHNETNPDYRPLSDTRGWCSICNEKVGMNEDLARDALQRFGK